MYAREFRWVYIIISPRDSFFLFFFFFRSIRKTRYSERKIYPIGVRPRNGWFLVFPLTLLPPPQPPTAAAAIPCHACTAKARMREKIYWFKSFARGKKKSPNLQNARTYVLSYIAAVNASSRPPILIVYHCHGFKMPLTGSQRFTVRVYMYIVNGRTLIWTFI